MFYRRNSLSCQTVTILQFVCIYAVVCVASYVDQNNVNTTLLLSVYNLLDDGPNDVAMVCLKPSQHDIHVI
jgi:hypothetical protein